MQSGNLNTNTPFMSTIARQSLTGVQRRHLNKLVSHIFKDFVILFEPHSETPFQDSEILANYVAQKGKWADSVLHELSGEESNNFTGMVTGE